MDYIFGTLDPLLPGMPAGSGWLALVMLVLLGAGAVIDLRLKRIPDAIILAGFLVTGAAQTLLVDLHFAGVNFAIGFAAGITLYAINELWFRTMKRDAFGMGDAKWTAVATAAFGIMPLIFAWVVGAWLGVAWLLVERMRKKKVTRIPFAPFLFTGLLTGFYWLYWR